MRCLWVVPYAGQNPPMDAVLSPPPPALFFPYAWYGLSNALDGNPQLANTLCLLPILNNDHAPDDDHLIHAACFSLILSGHSSPA